MMTFPFSMQITEAGIKWFKGRNGIIIVVLEDGSEVTSRVLSDQLSVSIQSAHSRIKSYMATGDLDDLFRKSNSRTKYSKRVIPIPRETHYTEGDIKQFFCPMWRLAMQNI